METTAEGKTSAKVISHYAGSGNALTWTSEGSEKWTRNIPGIDGALDAVQAGGGSIVLQLHDLQGNIVGTAGDSESETKLLSTYNSTEFGVPQPGTTPPKYAWLGAAGISTETAFGSGVATQGGASYVPQVARALQTAPVVPPGAFPNGSSGTQFTAAPVTAGAIAGAQEIATQFWQKAEAERQKAREEEAAAALRQCQEEGGCGAEGSGNGEDWIDPEKSILLTTKQAELVATVMRQGPTALDTLALSGIVGNLTSFLAERLAEIGKEYLQGVAYGLKLCYGEIDSADKAEARCKVYVDWVVEPIEEKDRIVAWGVETCYGASYKRKNSVHWTFPYCHVPSV